MLCRFIYSILVQLYSLTTSNCTASKPEQPFWLLRLRSQPSRRRTSHRTYSRRSRRSRRVGPSQPCTSPCLSHDLRRSPTEETILPQLWRLFPNNLQIHKLAERPCLAGRRSRSNSAHLLLASPSSEHEIIR